MKIYEACVGNYKDAVRAEKLGANRIELCDNLMEDGTTPSYGTIKLAVNNINVPIMTIIRPRGGSFEYSSEEVEIMKSDIEIIKSLGGYGVVIGALKEKKVDIDVIKQLVDVAKPMSITFHMAFDEIEDKYEAIDQLYDIGIDRILTKGGNNNAMEGRDEIKKLIKYSNGRVSIMPGKGVNKENRDYLLQYTGANEIHGTKVV